MQRKKQYVLSMQHFISEENIYPDLTNIFSDKEGKGGVPGLCNKLILDSMPPEIISCTLTKDFSNLRS